MPGHAAAVTPRLPSESWSLEQVMKKPLLVCLVFAVAVLAGCVNKRDIADGIVQVATPAAVA